MKTLFKIILCSLFLIQMPCAMENSVDVENIEFKNKNGTAFTLTPFHKLGKEKTSEGLFELFQNEQVYKYYESGTK